MQSQIVFIVDSCIPYVCMSFVNCLSSSHYSPISGDDKLFNMQQLCCLMLDRSRFKLSYPGCLDIDVLPLQVDGH